MAKTYRIVRIHDIGIPGSIIEPFTVYGIQRKTWFGWMKVKAYWNQDYFDTVQNAQTGIDLRTGKIKQETVQPI